MDPQFAELLCRVVETYHRALAEAVKVREWLASLGVANAALLDRFKVGWCAGTLGSMARGEVLDRLRLVGLLDADGTERFAGCVTVPVYDQRGAIVQIAGYRAEVRGTLPGSPLVTAPAGPTRGCGSLPSPSSPLWLFDETPVFWNAACLGHARVVTILGDPLAGIVEIAGGNEAAIAPAGPGTPLGQGARDVLLAHSPQVVLKDCDHLRGEVERLGIEVRSASDSGPASASKAVEGPDDEPRPSTEGAEASPNERPMPAPTALRPDPGPATGQTGSPVPPLVTPSFAPPALRRATRGYGGSAKRRGVPASKGVEVGEGESGTSTEEGSDDRSVSAPAASRTRPDACPPSVWRGRTTNAGERLVSQDANGFTVEFPRRLRFVVQGLSQETPRHLRASVKVFRATGPESPSTSRPSTRAPSGRSNSSAETLSLPSPLQGEGNNNGRPAPSRIHLDTLDLYHARSRIGFAKTAACLLGEDPTLMEDHLGRVVALAEEFLRKRHEPAPAILLTESEKTEALELLRDPNLLDRIVQDLATLGYVGEEENKRVAYLATVSRKLDDPLSILVLSRSAAGKSTLAEAIASLVPPEDLLRFTRLTAQTLYYQKPDSLAHKMVLLEEEEGVHDAAYALRVLQSARKLSLSTAAGQGEARTREVKGPVSIFVTTTRTDLDEETAGRFITLSVDESKEQTRAILSAQRAAEAHAPSERERLLRLHQNAQRLLEPVGIVNPYAPSLTFPDGPDRVDRCQFSGRLDHAQHASSLADGPRIATRACWTW